MSNNQHAHKFTLSSLPLLYLKLRQLQPQTEIVAEGEVRTSFHYRYWN